MYKILFSLLLTIFSANLFADSLSARVDRQKIEMGDIITLIVQTDFQTFLSPDFSLLKDQFEILGKQQSNQITMTNGNYESYTRWDLRLTPKQLGVLKIPPLTLAKVTSQPIKVEVVKPSFNQTKYGVSYFEASVNLNEAYVQQQIIYTLKFYHLGTLIRGNTRPPIFEDAISKQITKQINYQKNINGNQYEVYEWSWAFFPQKSGKLTISPQIFNGQLRYNGRSKRISQYSKAIDITIKAIPDSFPKHETWLPATSIKLAEEWQHNKVIRVGDSITRTLQIQAEGLQSSQLPEIELEQQAGFHHYPDQAKREDKITHQGIISQITHKIAIVPTSENTLTLPSHQLYWWNTVTDRLEIASLPEKKFNILESLNQAPTMPQNLESPIIVEEEPKKVEREESFNIWKLISLFFAIAWIITLASWLKQRKKSQKISERKTKKTEELVLDFCQISEPKDYYQKLMNWLKQQKNELQIKDRIKLDLNNLQAHLFNNQNLDQECLKNICEQIKQLAIENEKKHTKMKTDKLEKLYL